jgi:hypothetical protein
LKFLLLVATLSLSLFAETKNQQLSADSTVEKSERKAIVSLARLGMSSYNYNLPVIFCPKGDGKNKPKCRQIDRWKGSFSQKEIDELLAKDLNQLVSKRYDVIKFVGSRAYISTATDDISENIHKKAFFQFKTGAIDDFQNKTLDYLNKSNLEKILSLSTDSRYKEMNEQEQMSFLRTKGKESGIPFEIAKKLVNSAYSFSLYYGEISGKVTITETEIKLPKGGTQLVYSVNFGIPMDMELFVNEFDGNSFKLYNSIGTDRGAFGMMGVSVPSASKPTERDSKDLLTTALSDLFKENLIALNTKLKRDRNFKIIAPIESIDGSSVEFGMGCQEDIRIDHPFRVVRDVNGEEEELGFFKVRKSGKNCRLLPKAERENSIASAVKGSFEAYDLALEHPWTGVFGTLGFGTDTTDFSSGDLELEGGNLKFLRLGVKADLGYVTNSSPLSEIWLDFFFDLGTQDDIINHEYLGASEITGIGALGLGFEVAKRLYLVGGIYTDLGLGTGYKVYIYDYVQEDSSTDRNLNLTYLYVDPFAKLGYNFSPNFELYGKVGYTVPFGADYKLTNSEASETGTIDYLDGNGIDANGGVNASFGINIHTDFAGAFAKMFSAPPSQICEEMKTN